MNYKITNIRKISRCPKCRRYKTSGAGKCTCGYDWKLHDAREGKNIGKPNGKLTRIYESCPYCDAVGNQRDGLCERHAKVAELNAGITQWLGWRNGEEKNDIKIYRAVDSFINSILALLKPEDKLRAGWLDYKQKNLKRIPIPEPKPIPEQEEINDENIKRVLIDKHDSSIVSTQKQPKQEEAEDETMS